MDTNLFTQKVNKELKDFLSSPLKNQWLDFDECHIYVRKSQRLLDRSFYSCLDLASIEINASLRRQGLFKLILNIFCQTNPLPMLLIENVLNPHLYDYLSKQSNIKRLSDTSFYILKDKE